MMKTTGMPLTITSIVGLMALIASAQPAHGGLIVSYEAAKVQSTSVSGATTETFDPLTYPVGVYKNVDYATRVGTFTSPAIAVVAANAYGGAGGLGNYIAIGSESGSTSATLSFGKSESYFGFWWSAADAANSVDLYSAGKLVGSLASANLLNDLGSAYNGNPNNGQDTNEKFAYLNIYGTNGTTFDQVVFRNATTSTGFELDNISIAASYTAITGTTVNTAIVPEPASLTLVGLGGLLGGGVWLSHRRRQRLKTPASLGESSPTE